MKNNNNLLEVPNINSKDAKLKKLIYEVDDSLFNEDKYFNEEFEHLCVCSGGTTSSCAKNGFTTLDLRKNYNKIHLDRKTNLATIGGGVIMNSGCYGEDISKILISIDVVDLKSGQKKTFKNGDIKFHYRGTDLPDNFLITSILLGLLLMI